MPEGTTYGVWIPEDEDVVDRFDEQFRDAHASSRRTYSRSEKIKHSMECYMVIRSICRKHELQFDDERELRHWLRQVLIDHARCEDEEARN